MGLPGVTDEPAKEGAHDAQPIDLLAQDPSVETLRELLHEVIDPEIGLDIVELGLLRHVEVDNGIARVRFTVTTPACPLSSYIEDEIRSCLWQLPALREVEVELELDPPWSPDEMTDVARDALGWER
ncbi:MAG: metal-sulfur cluster assembly factor [Solirubrobacteraceae bacterium]|nr:metal-sulfur cluster assembly factor [Solirubrobacteraceae bacterium]